MITNDRISRKQRLKKFGKSKAKIAVILALILVALVMGKAFRSKFVELLSESFISDIFQNRYAESLDSLAIQTGRGFLLNKSPELGAVSLESAGLKVQRVYQPWPSALPLLFYSRNLQEVCDKYGIEFECIMHGAKDSLSCRLKSGDRHELQVVVIPDRKTELDKRSLGIIFKNIYQLENREIIRLIDSGIPFGYLATSEVFPAGDIKKRLRSKRVTSIISVSASKKDLAEHTASGRKGGSGYATYVSDLLDLHPNLAYIDIERSDAIDYEFVKEFIEAAQERRIDYIYRNREPDRIDSLAYAAGLTFITYDIISDYMDRDFAEIRGVLTAELILSKNPVKIIISLDISKIRIGELVDFLKYLKRLGINILYINKLPDDPEFTTTDL